MVPEFTTRTAPNPVVTFGRVLPKFSASSTGSANAEPQRVSSGPWAAEKKGSDQIPPLGPAVPALFVLQHNPKEVCIFMKKALLVLLVVVAVGAMASAQDVLGAHLGYGRGCVMCHAPHSGPAGNNKATNDAQAGEYALWGQDLTPLYGQSLTFSGDGKATYAVTLPAKGAITSAHDANTIILFCLSCHDGNLAKVGMMKGVTVETLPVVGGNAPTLLGADGTGSTNMYQNDHPVGGSATVTCGSQYTLGLHRRRNHGHHDERPEFLAVPDQLSRVLLE